MPVSLRGGYFCGRFRLRSEVGLFFCFCVLATGGNAQTTPTREYIHVGTRVIAIEVPTPAVAAPTFSPGFGNYSAPQTVTISTSTAGATIRYTLDGTTPTESYGTVGTSGTSVSINSSGTLKALAYKSGMTDSTVTSVNYGIGQQPYAKLSISGASSSSSFHPGDPFFVSLQSTIPNTSFLSCSNIIQPCQTDPAQTTGQDGNWSLSGSFDNPFPYAMNVQQWVQFPQVTSNTISFTVAYAILSIAPTTTFHAGDAWTVSLQSNIPNAKFTACWNNQPCQTDQGPTRSDGTWSQTGNFPNPLPAGFQVNWQNWAVFPQVTSNTISFTVN